MDRRRTCRNIARHLSDHMDETVPEFVRERIEKHLAACPECVHELRALRWTTEQLASSPAERLRTATRDALLQHFRDSSPPRRSEAAPKF
ncbi:MAG: anti-sigma factor family protein [Longimicrobiales bacterium]